ncbi:hypothetical protein [Pseudonocardia spinosispora]|uniref:hypothetical protein n=1 Tax=Pseudonocardia spinosispora TaxID=103441 RepID=UPI00040E7E05|nr:hypothetical protein [Pseudonocardia spinosispora]
MALDRTGTPDASDSDGGPQPAAGVPEKPAYGDESRGDPTSFGEQATTLMPPLPPAPAMPKPPTPEEEEATARSNKRLTWVLSGAVVLVGILLFSVLGNGSDSSAVPIVQAPLDTAASQASDLPTTSAAPPTTSALPTTSVAPPPPPPPTSVYVPPPPPRTTYRPTPRTTPPRTTRTTPRTTRSEPKTTRRSSSNDDDKDKEKDNKRSSNPYDYPDSSGGSRGLGL